jgi:hypothetical protein
MSARDLQLLSKVLALFVMFQAGTLATVAGILAYDVIMAGGSPITTELFGPEVHATPALVWTYAQQFAALFALAGAAAVASQSHWWRAGAGMMVVGNLFLAGLMGLLAYHARTAPDGIVMFAMCLGAGLPWSLAGAGIGAAVLWIERAAR